MTTLDDLKRVEREMRAANDQSMASDSCGWWADTIAAYVREAQKQMATGVQVPDRIVGPFLNKGERDDAQVWNDCIDEVLRLNASAPTNEEG